MRMGLFRERRNTSVAYQWPISLVSEGNQEDIRRGGLVMTPQTKNPGGQAGVGAFTATNSSANYSKSSIKYLIVLIEIYGLTLIFLADWLIRVGGVLHDK